MKKRDMDSYRQKYDGTVLSDHVHIFQEGQSQGNKTAIGFYCISS